MRLGLTQAAVLIALLPTFAFNVLVVRTTRRTRRREGSGAQPRRSI
jgi:hypothetical protein